MDMEQLAEDREEAKEMRRRRLWIRRWLTVAVAFVALSLTSSASAMVAVGDGGGGRSAVVGSEAAAIADTGSSGFSWSDAAIGAIVTLGATAACAGALRVAGNRRRFAGLPR
jgi:hypothetical protein